MTGTTEYPSHIRKSIRDTQRMLARPNLPATVRQQQERKLRALQLAVEGKAVLEMQQKMSSKYRMVRFFESKKAVRHLRLALVSGDAEEIQEAAKDVLYVKFFPKDSKYISLFPSEPCVDEAVLAKRTEMREAIFAEHGAEMTSEAIQLLVAKPASGSKKSADEDDEEEEEEEEDEEEDEDDDDEDDDESDDDLEDDDEEDDSASGGEDGDDSDSEESGSEDEFDDEFDSDDDSSDEEDDDTDSSDSEDDASDDSADFNSDSVDFNSGDEDDDSDDDSDGHSDPGSSRKKSRS